MIQNAFIDSDIILDAGLARAPFFQNSKMVLVMMENKLVQGFTSSICIANIDYFLRKADGEDKTRFFLSQLLSFITSLPVNHNDILQALKSDFSDFEDAMQYHAAKNNKCDCIITRNTDDYRKSEIPIYTPDEFVSLFS